MSQQGPRPPDWFSNFLLESAQADLDVFRGYELEHRALENENEMLKALFRDKEVQLSVSQTALDQHSMELSNAEERIKNLVEKLKTKDHCHGDLLILPSIIVITTKRGI